MDDTRIILGDIKNEEHQRAMIQQLDLYMQDPMGGVGPISEDLSTKVLEGLKKQSNYIFFLAIHKGEYVGFANCYINFSTFKARQYINIHDFAVSKEFRSLGIGKRMMSEIVGFAKENGFSKVTLEVRDDNNSAQKLYRSMGFRDCIPPMFYWEKVID